MKHTDIEKLAKEWIVDAADSPANKRVQEITLRLVTDLCKAIEDLDITPTEFWKGLEYFSEAGARNELGLLAPGIGLERFLDMRADEADEKAGLTGGTPRAIEGPLYVAGAPESKGFARMDDGTEVDKAEPLFMQGTVYGADGKPLANAKVEMWHANTLGGYSFFDKTQSPYNLRRTIFTDENGRYAMQSIMPNGYGCPPDGSTQALLDLLGRHGNRPAHVHYFVTAPGHRKLTTQINIDGDKYLWDDFAFASREGLVPPVLRISDPAEMKAKGVSKPFASIDFDIQMVVEKPAAASGIVDRAHFTA
jgi:catechol 1,2-dioxygenase